MIRFSACIAAGMVAMCILTTDLRAGWSGAWPACENAGKLWYDETQLYRQAWAVDVWNALQERSSVLYTNGWVQFAGGTTSSWWRSEAGVRARVVHREGEVLEFFKDRTAELARYFVDPAITDVNEAVEARWALHEDTITVTSRTGCSSGKIATNDVSVTYTFFRQKSYPEVPSTALTNFAEDHTQTRFAGTNLLVQAGAPLYFWDTHPNRLRGGYCGPDGGLGEGFNYLVPTVGEVENGVEVTETSALSPCSGADIEVGVSWQYSSTMPEVTGTQSFVTYGEPISNPGEQWLGGVYTGQVYTVSTNTYPIKRFAQSVTVAVTNTCSDIATNVVVLIDVNTNLTIKGVSGFQSVLRWLRWQDWKTRPIQLALPKMTPGQSVEFRLNLEWHRDQGNATVYPDFGWENLRQVIDALDATVVGGLGAFPEDDEIEMAWWYAGTDSNSFGQALNDDVNDYTNGSWSTVTAFVEGGSGDETETIDRTASPVHSSLALAGSFVDGQLCDQYWISRGYTWNTASVTNIAKFVHRPTNFTYTVHVASNERLRYAWSALDCTTLESGSATNNFTTTAKYGDTGFPAWPGDPVANAGPRDNITYVSETSRQLVIRHLFAVLTWDFEYDAD